jgi:subfamily B ATP-binding cassette protein HlyB/CyaB
MADARGSSNCGENQGGPLPVSSGLVCLCVMAGHHQRAHSPGWDPAAPLDEAQLLLGARQLGLEAKPLRSSWDGLARVHLPVIAEFHDNSYVLVLRRDGADSVLIGDPRASRPQPLDREQFTALWREH